MILNKKYVVGTLIQFYELEMVPELIQSYCQMLDGIENPENVTFHFCFSQQEYLEKIDWVGLEIGSEPDSDWIKESRLQGRVNRLINPLTTYKCIVDCDSKTNNNEFYNIAAYRRELNYNWCEKTDYILWGECDSFFPKRTFSIIESLDNMVASLTPKFIASFAQRKLWGNDWKNNEHPMFEKVQYQETDEWILNNEASDKSYMTISRMNEINESMELSDIQIDAWLEPKFDGSCLVISSELIKAGVNIPHALLCSGEDTSLGVMAKLILGDNFVQYHIVNQLHVHNRRHPKKRTFVLNEDNPRGFCGDDKKGQWWSILENASKFNLSSLRNQVPFIKMTEVFDKIKNA